MTNGPGSAGLVWRGARTKRSQTAKVRASWLMTLTLLRAVALHQLVGLLRIPGSVVNVVQEKSHHLRPVPALWPQNLKCNVVELLVGSWSGARNGSVPVVPRVAKTFTGSFPLK